MQTDTPPPHPGQRWDPSASTANGVGWDGAGKLGAALCVGAAVAELCSWDATHPGIAPVFPSCPAAGWGVPGRGQLSLFLIQAPVFICFEFAV